MLKVYYQWSVQLQITQLLFRQSNCKKTSVCKKQGGCAPPAPALKFASVMQEVSYSQDIC